ncbi:MinD/ParA family protein [Mycobacterium sp. MYCO198283]|nr:MinD/ParA family protein [Mycobacterium sp. MYCO198283]MCG5432343.1 MinD/ParA family protein [Mycobacterium sp. MYCO198283]
MTEQTVSPPAAAASPYPSAGGFRAERRFTDPADAPPPEWTADTPPTGFAAPVTTASPPAAQAQPPAAQAQPPAPPHFGGYPNPIPPPVAQAQPPAAQAQPPTAQAQPPAPPHFGGYTNPIPPPVAPGGPLQAPSTPTSRDLSTSALLRQSKPAPSGGWRRWLYLATGRLVNVGESPKHSHRQALLAQVNAPLQGCYRIALLSLKGGVGKTTITATLGATFASIRGDRVIAVDANPDRGTLSQKVPLETPATVRHLLRDAEGISRYSDVRSYTSQGPSRLEVLASESDPAVSEAFSAEDYARTLEILEKFYSLVLTDCGTGLMHSAMSSVLSKADALIVVSSGSVDGARSASATLDWLDAHGYQDLVRRSVAVVNAVRPRSGKVDMQKVVDHFSRRCKAVRLVPFDPHLEEGAEIDLDRLRRETREALIELAAVVADGFPEADRTRQLFA